MKQTIASILALLMFAAILSGCSQPIRQTDNKISVVCTIFPQYDWVRQILGDKADNMELTLLLGNKVDLHSYQPTVDDIVKISTCDLLIYVGGESDGWVDDALKDATNKNMAVINLLDVLGAEAKTEELIEGMEEEEHEHNNDDFEHEGEYDEHVWLSLKNTRTFCTVIADALSSLDINNADEYKSNLDEYIGKLNALDDEYKSVTKAATVKTLLFGDRFPFRYLLDDYGLSYYAAFPGCSAETEASFETVVFLAEKVDELELKSIMVTESSDKKIAETIISNTMAKNQQVLVLDSLQAVTKNDAKSEVTYISVMESNLNVLKEALR